MIGVATNLSTGGISSMSGDDATGFLTAPDEAMFNPDGTILREENRIERVTCNFKSNSERFVIKERKYRQFGHLYARRYRGMVGALKEAGQKKWNAPFLESILNISKGKRVFFVGTVYKDMALKPSILDEISAREDYQAPPEIRSNYSQAEDSLMIEDMSGRIELSGAIDAGPLVTGVIIAVLGHEDSDGAFVVEDHCNGTWPIQRPLPEINDKFVILTSGFNIGQDQTDALLPLQLLTDFITGQSGSNQDQEFASKICRVLIAGNMIEETKLDMLTQAAYKSKNVAAESVGHMKELDFFLSQLAASVPVDLMPGFNDPSNHALPQQPLHKCLFPSSARLGTMTSLTNPADYEIDGCRFMGSSGQGVDDIVRYSTTTEPLDALEKSFQWLHMFPTAPDTLTVYPFFDKDPFLISTCPHVYFASNQAKFDTRVITGGQGQSVRLISIPRFDETHTVVALNLRTLECQPMSFDVSL